MRRVATSVAAILAAAALTSCGSDDEGGDAKDEPSAAPTSASSETCAESFNTDAPVDFARLVRLSHADGAPILTGFFTGTSFTDEIFDKTIDGDGVETTVVPGACVVTEPGDADTLLYVFVVGEDGAWHRFLESDPAVLLAIDPTSRLDDVVEVTLEEGQTSDHPELVPTGS